MPSTAPLLEEPSGTGSDAGVRRGQGAMSGREHLAQADRPIAQCKTYITANGTSSLASGGADEAWPTTVARRMAAHSVVQHQMNICSLFACSARLSLLGGSNATSSACGKALGWLADFRLAAAD